MSSVKEYSGNGAFFYPPITVYESENDKILVKLEKWKTRKIVINKLYDTNFRVLITEDGGVCPIIGKNPNPIDFLNVIFATFTTSFFPCYHMRPSDFTGFTWKENDNSVTMNRMYQLGSLRSQLEVKRDSESTFHDWLMMPREPIKKSTMVKVLDFAHVIYQNNELKSDILLIGEAFSLFFDQMHKASFLYSWMLIENFLERVWHNHVDSLFQNNTVQIKILKEFVRNTSDNYIKMFTELGKIDTKACQALHKFREIRNDIVHEKYTPTSDETHDCLMCALLIFTNRIENKNPFDGIKLDFYKS
ncbi:MAG: hypothetical protein AB1608_08095 [Thermoproteota archaeon]